MAAKPCASCGSPVADTALERGALETPDGKRYCSPCAGKLRKGASSGPVILAPDRPKPKIVPSGAPAPEDFALEALDPAEFPLAEDEPREEIEISPLGSPKPETVQTAAGSPQAAASKPGPATMRPSRRIKGGGSRRKKPRRRRRPSDRDKPGSERQPAAKAAVGNNSARVTPERRRSTARELPEDSGTSRRTSRRSAFGPLPWYFRLNRGQWIGIATGGVAFLIFVIVCTAWVASPHRTRRTRNPPPLPISGNPMGLMAEAQRLFQSGERRKALEMLEAAKEIARKQGNDHLVVQINRKLHGIRFKTAP